MGIAAAGLLGGLAVVSPAADAHTLCSKRSSMTVPVPSSGDPRYTAQACVYESAGGYITARVLVKVELRKTRKAPTKVKIGVNIYPTLGRSKEHECDITSDVRAAIKMNQDWGNSACYVKLKNKANVSFYARGFAYHDVASDGKDGYWLFTNSSPKHA